MARGDFERRGAGQSRVERAENADVGFPEPFFLDGGRQMAVGVDSSPRANVERTGISRGAPDTMAPLPLLLRPLNESKRWGGAFVSALSSNVFMVCIRVTSVMFPPRFSRLGRSISRACACVGGTRDLALDACAPWR